MISDVKKLVFIGVKEDLDLFFNRSQQRGIIEFIASDPAALKQMPKYIEEMMAAIKVLKHYSIDVESHPDKASAKEMVDEVLMLKKKVETLQEELIHIRTEIVKLRPLGHFDLEDIERFELLSGQKMTFFSAKRGKKEGADFPQELIYLATDHELDFFTYIGKEGPNYHDLNELELTYSLSEWQEREKRWIEQIKGAEKRLKELAIHQPFLRESLVHQLNHVNLVKAKESIQDELDGSLFVINGWVPEKRLHEVISICDDLGIHFEEVAIEEGDRTPTYMENKKLGSVGEDLVHIYDTPAPEDKDPSRWVAIAFTIFFAIIVADAGYGFLYFLVAMFLRWKVYPKAKEMMKRFIKLLIMLSSAAMIWGVLTCSYFSINVAPDNPLSKYSLLNYLVEKKAEYHMKTKDDVYEEWTARYPTMKEAKTPSAFLADAVQTEKGRTSYLAIKEFEDNILMEFSLIIGILHVALSFLRNLRKCWAGIGWVAFMVGGYLYFPEMLNATTILHFLGVVGKQSSFDVGLQLLFAGVGTAVILSLIQNKLKGIGEVVTSIQIFADVLSYLRLYALGLAGMIMADTFNKMGGDIGFLYGGIFITMIGHAVNIVLGIMGGVIHGLRLNFLEWYHYSFEGGGKIFSPLKLFKTH